MEDEGQGHEQAYERFAPFYRPLVGLRSFFEKQALLLNELLPRLGITHEHRILDAACGTGDVLAGLIEAGYRRVAGADASEGMVAQARAIPELRETELSICRWQELPGYFNVHGSFDFVFLLGHALPHVGRDEVAHILKNVFQGLNSGGTVAFDMRNWICGHDGSLLEPERPVGVYRWLGEVEVNGRRFWIDDRCAYHNGRQLITYRIRRVREDGAGWDEETKLGWSATKA